MVEAVQGLRHHRRHLSHAKRRLRDAVPQRRQVPQRGIRDKNSKGYQCSVQLQLFMFALQVTTANICGSNGFLSLVFKATVHFDNRTREPYVFVLKIPQRESVLSIVGKEDCSDENVVSHYCCMHSIKF